MPLLQWCQHQLPALAAAPEAAARGGQQTLAAGPSQRRRTRCCIITAAAHSSSPSSSNPPPPQLQLQRQRRRGAVTTPRAAASTAQQQTQQQQAASSQGSQDFSDDEDPAGLHARAMLRSGLVDFYEILGVDDDAPPEEIKKAYRSLAKECHPDYLGDEGHNICILLNEAYEVLSDEGARAAYNAQLEVALSDEEDDYTGEPLSKWIPTTNPKMARNEDPAENRAVFVDENTCIGCKQCVWHAPGCFRIEPEYGRSRVYAQWLNNEDDLQAAIDSCPVSCIYWVEREQLSALEYVMQNRVERVNVGVMMAGQGMVADVFAATASFIKERKRKEEEAARAKRKYSPQQEEARRKASEALLRDHMGFFAGLFTKVAAEINANVEGDGSGLRVGRRTRARYWHQRAGGSSGSSSSASSVSSLDSLDGGEYFMVPPERALVPVAVYSQKED